MITRKMTPFFSSTLRVLFVGIFHLVPPLHYVLVCKIHMYIPKMTLSSLLTWISFFYIKFANFWYIKCSVPNLIPIWPRSYGLMLVFSIQLLKKNPLRTFEESVVVIPQTSKDRVTLRSVRCFLHPINHILATGWRKLNMFFIYHF